MTEAADRLAVGGLNVSRETFAALQQLEALVRRWTPAINLVSKNSLLHLWDRHIEDSAQIFSQCPVNARTWVDLGSGGGFPGLVVAILARELKPDLEVTLVESDLRKATFLRQASQLIGLSVVIHSERLESLAPLHADVLSARALAGLPDLVKFAHAHLQPTGVAIFPKGARYQEELAQAKQVWTFDVETLQSLSESEAAILVIRNIHRAGHD